MIFSVRHYVTNARLGPSTLTLSEINTFDCGENLKEGVHICLELMLEDLLKPFKAGD